MARVPHLTPERFTDIVGEVEVLQIAGTGNPGTSRIIDATKLGDAVTFADRMVEGYVRGRYPGGVTHPMLEGLAADIARYRLRSDVNGATISEEVRKRYEYAHRALKDIQAGKTLLTDEDGTPLGEADGPGGSVQGGAGVHSAMPAPRIPAALDGYR